MSRSDPVLAAVDRLLRMLARHDRQLPPSSIAFALAMSLGSEAQLDRVFAHLLDGTPLTTLAGWIAADRPQIGRYFELLEAYAELRDGTVSTPAALALWRAVTDKPTGGCNGKLVDS
jgi:hypothetical protein